MDDMNTETLEKIKTLIIEDYTKKDLIVPEEVELNIIINSFAIKYTLKENGSLFKEKEDVGKGSK